MWFLALSIFARLFWRVRETLVKQSLYLELALEKLAASDSWLSSIIVDGICYLLFAQSLGGIDNFAMVTVEYHIKDDLSKSFYVIMIYNTFSLTKHYSKWPMRSQKMYKSGYGRCYGNPTSKCSISKFGCLWVNCVTFLASFLLVENRHLHHHRRHHHRP